MTTDIIEFRARGRLRRAPVCGWIGPRVSKPVLVYEYPSRPGQPDLLVCDKVEHGTSVRRLTEKQLVTFKPVTAEGKRAVLYQLNLFAKQNQRHAEVYAQKLAENEAIIRALDRVDLGDWVQHPGDPRYYHDSEIRRAGADKLHPNGDEDIHIEERHPIHRPGRESEMVTSTYWMTSLNWLRQRIDKHGELARAQFARLEQLT